MLKQPTRTLVSQNDSAMIEKARIPRSIFKNRWSRKTTFDAGHLIPILVDEIYPGDHMKYDITAFIRIQTMLFPMFDQQRIDTHFFFVPNRLLWDNWVRLMGQQDNPDDSINYTVPIIEPPANAAAMPVGSIFDHFGLPWIVGLINPNTEWSPTSALPFRAYNLIFNEWFRDENLQGSMAINKDNGPDATAQYSLMRRAKSHDYFTSALPWPQKFTTPNLPLSGIAPILGLGFKELGEINASQAVYETDGGNPTWTQYRELYGAAATGGTNVLIKAQPPGVPAVYADLAEATGVTINQFRNAFMLQALLERDARGGTRYVEKILSHFGVMNPDFRLQRPEYIGGGQSTLNITPVAQTAESDDSPLGALAAAGTAVGQHRASYAATEHGYIIGLLSVKTELSYQRKLDKHWSRQTQHDYYFPSLAQLGEQAILRKEIFALGTLGADEEVFGYQERWQELRTRTSEVTGYMRSGISGTLDQWHLSQHFETFPTLSSAFIEDIAPMARVLAAGELTQGFQYLADIEYRRTATRPLPTYGTPALLGRF